jgi:DNA-binding transcriptional LysR family regulator
MDRLQAMETFVGVVEQGNFSAAARQAGVARSVVTRQVAALEKHLGVKLLNRTTRRLSLTSAGTRYLEKCRVILNLAEAAESDLAEERAELRGRIRIGLPLSFGLKRVAPLLLQFATRHPEVSLEADYTDRRLNLIGEGFDLSIRVTSRLAPGDVSRRLGRCRIVAVAAPDYLARHGTPAYPTDLQDHECLAYLGDANPNLWSFDTGGRIESFPIRSRFSASNGEALLEAAAQGFGITLQPDFIVDEWLADGRVVPVLVSFPAPGLGVYALLPSGTHMPFRVRALVEYLATHLKGEQADAGPGRQSGSKA